MYNTRMMKFVLGKLQNKMSGRNPFDRTRINKLLAEFIKTYFL